MRGQKCTLLREELKWTELAKSAHCRWLYMHRTVSCGARRATSVLDGFSFQRCFITPLDGCHLTLYFLVLLLPFIISLFSCLIRFLRWQLRYPAPSCSAGKPFVQKYRKLNFCILIRLHVFHMLLANRDVCAAMRKNSSPVHCKHCNI
jgi:hypothetical protein